MNFIIFVGIALVTFISTASAQIDGSASVDFAASSEVSSRSLLGQQAIRISIELAISDAISNLNVSALPVQLQVCNLLYILITILIIKFK